MKDNQDIELLKTAEAPDALIGFVSVSRSLKKLIFDEADITKISATLADVKNINSLTLMNFDMQPRESLFSRNGHITRYVFINVIFETWNELDIMTFLDTMILDNKIIDTLIFRECVYSSDFTKILLDDVRLTNAPLQILELGLTGSELQELARMISMTNTIHVLRVDAMGFFQEHDTDAIILDALKENVSIVFFEYPLYGLFHEDETKELITTNIEYNIMHMNMYNIFKGPHPDLSRFISQHELLQRYLEEEKELKRQRFGSQHPVIEVDE